MCVWWIVNYLWKMKVYDISDSNSSSFIMVWVSMFVLRMREMIDRF